ncbi:mitotic spindle assembly checkpoint protein MAD1-like [Macrobrachium nipponense]|uniref:mitotic spindle assembly checkpoint protein MAD1-like n=1 Tax=Macrobrachium nipponense TaxID=159736 RepID=UPI0030C8AC82
MGYGMHTGLSTCIYSYCGNLWRGVKTPLALGGLLGRARQCIEGQKALQIAQDAAATARMDADDDLFYATEMISLLKEDWMEAQDENLFLLDEIDDMNFNEAALIQTNEDLLDQLQEEKNNVEKREKECQENRQKVEELKRQAEDNDFYCGYLEEKVKAHEAERKRLTQVATELEQRLRVSQREPASVLARNLDQVKNHGRDTQETQGLQKEAHIMEARVQSLPKKNKMKSLRMMPRLRESNGNTFYKLGRLEEACECFLRLLMWPTTSGQQAETGNVSLVAWCQGSEEERQRKKEIMQKVNYANGLLHDAEERREYDAVREFIKEQAARVFEDPQEAMKVKEERPGRRAKRMNTKGH